MAVTTKQPQAQAAETYTVLRAFVWTGGEVLAVGAPVELTPTQAAELLSANKVAPGAPAKPAKAKAKAAEAKAPEAAASEAQGASQDATPAPEATPTEPAQ